MFRAPTISRVLSQCTDLTVGWPTVTWFNRGRLLDPASKPALGPTQPPTQWVDPMQFFPRGETHLGCEVDLSLSYNADIKNMWSHTGYVFKAQCLIKHSDNFTFTLPSGPSLAFWFKILGLLHFNTQFPLLYKRMQVCVSSCPCLCVSSHGPLYIRLLLFHLINYWLILTLLAIQIHLQRFILFNKTEDCHEWWTRKDWEEDARGLFEGILPTFSFLRSCIFVLYL